jgi:hypothetical protein
VAVRGRRVARNPRAAVMTNGNARDGPIYADRLSRTQHWVSNAGITIFDRT